jgi:agmatine/peptidylarginine deiminase
MPDPSMRLPAEWEPQAAVLVAWPHEGTDWAPRLSEVERTYVSLVAAIARFEHALVCVPDASLEHHVRELLDEAGAERSRVHFVHVPYDDTWLRDSGPITLRTQDGFRLLDFRFTGWGGKYEANRDDALVRKLFDAGVFSDEAMHLRTDWALEGGAIECDGQGTILTTWRCLQHRHPGSARSDIEDALKDTLAAERVLWLEHGYLQGDDTDAHIDTLARFAPGQAIVHQHCDDPSDPHHAELEAMRRELRAMRTADGQPYRLHALPWAAPIIDQGRRLAASYANYLIVNDAVLMPAYDDPSDEVAAAIIRAAHPGRTVVQIPCRPLIWQNGSLHCVTMQLPQGLFAPR